MEGFLTYYYEYHFLYITGIEHVESKNIQGAALMKLVFHPGTDMSQAMARGGRLREPRARVHAAGRGAAVHRALRRRQRAGRATGLLEPDPRPGRDAGHRAEPRAAAVRHAARRLRAAAVRRQPAHHRGPRGSGAAARLPYVAGGGDRRRESRHHGDAVRQRAHRRPDPHRVDQRRARREPSGAARHAGAHWAPARRSTCATSARSRTARHRHRLRARQRPAHGLHPGDQARRRLDARR